MLKYQRVYTSKLQDGVKHAAGGIFVTRCKDRNSHWVPFIYSKCPGGSPSPYSPKEMQFPQPFPNHFPNRLTLNTSHQLDLSENVLPPDLMLENLSYFIEHHWTTYVYYVFWKYHIFECCSPIYGQPISKNIALAMYIYINLHIVYEYIIIINNPVCFSHMFSQFDFGLSDIRVYTPKFND